MPPTRRGVTLLAFTVDGRPQDFRPSDLFLCILLGGNKHLETLERSDGSKVAFRVLSIFSWP